MAARTLKVGIVGAGNVGQTLGARLAAANGVELKYGVRSPAKHPGLAALPVAEAAAWADVVIVATPGWRDAEGAGKVAADLGAGVAGKAVIDATNPLSPWPKLEVLWDGTSGGELLQDALPDAFVYKAFNTLGLEHMAEPQGALAFGGAAAAAERGPITMLFAGAEDKRADAAAVISAVGFAPRYVGPIRYARNLEAIAELWIHLGVAPAGLNAGLDWGRDFVFQAVGGKGGP